MDFVPKMLISAVLSRLVGIHSAFRASSITNQPHFRLKQKYLDMLFDFAKETQMSVNKV
jgi:hypothetical protein